MFDLFGETFWRLFQSPAGLGDVSATSPSVAATSRRLILSVTSPRRPRNFRANHGCHLVWRRLQDVSLVRAQAIFWSPESPRLISRGDVSASEIGPLHSSYEMALHDDEDRTAVFLKFQFHCFNAYLKSIYMLHVMVVDFALCYKTCKCILKNKCE